LWNSRESRLDGKNREAVEVNAKIDKLLLAIHSAFDSLVERKKPFDAEAVKVLFQGRMDSQTTLLALLTQHMEELKARIGIDCASTTLSTYFYTHRSLGEFIKKKFKAKDMPEAIALIEKYRDEDRDTLFPWQSAEMVKANMKGLRVLADIKEPMTYHSGRHSFASLITLEEGVPIETISRMLGHSNIQTTQVYARVTPKKLFEDMDKLIEATQDLKLVI
jgi:integrase